MTPSTSDDESLLADIAQQEEHEYDAAAAGARAAEAKAAKTISDPYPPETLKTDPVEDVEDDEFALPTSTQTRTEAADADRMTPEEMQQVVRDPFESHPPQRIIMAEMQKDMLRARLILMHTFETDKTPAGDAVLRILKVEKPEMYADLIVRVAITMHIAWQKGMGL